MAFVYKVTDIAITVDGVEIVGLMGAGITPKGDQDSVKPIKDWSGKTIGYAVKDDTDCEGSITVQASSESLQYLIGLAASKKQVQVVITAKNREALNFSKITADDCVFFFPEFKPGAEEANAEFKFIGTNFQME